MARVVLVAVAVLALLVGGGYWLFRAYPTETAGAVGALLLIVALCLRGRPACPGLHCAGCSRH
jgi:hypothetical protein